MSTENTTTDHLIPPAGGCGCCGDACASRGTCRHAEENPPPPGSAVYGAAPTTAPALAKRAARIADRLEGSLRTFRRDNDATKRAVELLREVAQAPAAASGAAPQLSEAQIEQVVRRWSVAPGYQGPAGLVRMALAAAAAQAAPAAQPQPIKHCVTCKHYGDDAEGSDAACPECCRDLKLSKWEPKRGAAGATGEPA